MAEQDILNALSEMKTEINTRLDGIDARLDKIDNSFLSVGKMFVTMQKEFENLNTELSTSIKLFEKIHENFNTHDDRIKKLEAA